MSIFSYVAKLINTQVGLTPLFLDCWLTWKPLLNPYTEKTSSFTRFLQVRVLHRQQRYLS